MSKYHYEKTKPDLWEQLKKELRIDKHMLTNKTMLKLINRYEDQGGGYITPDYAKGSSIKVKLKHKP